MQTIDRASGGAGAEGFGADQGVMAFILQLRIDMLMGLPGMYCWARWERCS
ncbi:hypothetical protein AB5I41_24595 [Sphingomonas sp. MMS24-JH45]